ncbi:MAG: DUF5677 domain-containing protein [Candidatus Bathyarchaeota archaeon]|nr:DUF5677 domain-containing protein [Candidatus Bathyarchaeota archaeon]
MDELYESIENLLNKYGKSIILQNYFRIKFESFFYATLINLFFLNLNEKIVKELNLPRGKIGYIKSEFKLTTKNVSSALSLSLKDIKIDYECYENFKRQLKIAFPDFIKINQEIEKQIEFEKSKDYLSNIEEKIKKQGINDPNLNVFFITSILESLIQHGKEFFSILHEEKMIKTIMNEVIPELSKEIVGTLHTTANQMLNSQKKIQKGFEKRLYHTWKEPLDLYECLIMVSSECGEQQKIKLNNKINDPNQSKHEALIKIHARSLQISNEILVLLKAGYADGANSRWRSLHELAVISYFLCANNDELSRRYLDHDIVRMFKEAGDYKDNYKKLGYDSISRKEFNKIKKEKEYLCRKYPDKFQEDYGWIPRSILSNRNFGALEKNVKFGKYHPFYNLSCDSIHGGAKGFYRLGLMHEYQDKFLLVGPSNYGLADPLQNSAISLTQITLCLLGLEPDVENIIQMNVISNYMKNIGVKAVAVQEGIEERERLLSTI